MPVHMLAEEYKTASEAQAIKNWLNATVALRLDKANTGDDGGTTSIRATVFTGADDEGSPALIDSVRILGQLSGFAIGDVVIVHVVPYGQRGQVLAPPADKDKTAEALAARFADES